MKASDILSSLFFSVLLFSKIQDALGYATPQPRTNPSTNAWNLPSEIDDQSPSKVNQRKATSETNNSKPSRITYDLGLGKNKPVVSNIHPPTLAMDDMDSWDPLIHWNEYESVREFPSPLNIVESDKLAIAAAPTKRRKIVSINPTRYMEDSLPILPKSPQKVASFKSQVTVPVMTRSDASQQLDVNTVWVEMLIHSEQLRFATATAR